MAVLTEEEGTLALALARSAISHALARTPEAIIPPSRIFSEKRGVFVTLKERGELRGCIGFPYPMMPLGAAIRDAAVAAAIEDPRFPPVARSEIGKIQIEVTVLTPPVLLEGEPEDRPNRIVIGKHGLIARGRGMSGLLLPQVPAEWSWGPEEFLDHTCMKAGLPGKCWKDRAIEFYTFEGRIFTEPESAPPGTGN
ncbi:MAG: TIGR00296 family protein [Methanoregulaceae archaeon]